MNRILRIALLSARSVVKASEQAPIFSDPSLSQDNSLHKCSLNAFDFRALHGLSVHSMDHPHKQTL